MLDLLDKTEEAAQTASPPEASAKTSERRWSERRTLAFVIVASSLLWGLVLLGIYGILSLIAAR